MGFFRRQRQEAQEPPVSSLWGDGPPGSPVATGPGGDLEAQGAGDRVAGPQWGLPTRCPRCGGFGYLDRIDLVHEVMHQHCPTCWHRWDLSKAEVDAATAASD